MLIFCSEFQYWDAAVKSGHDYALRRQKLADVQKERSLYDYQLGNADKKGRCLSRT